MSTHLVTINIVVLNGEKYIRHCLGSVFNQTYPHDKIEINIIDNGSTDSTKEIIKEGLEIGNWKLEIPQIFFHEMEKNLGMWGGQEKALEFSNGKYIMALSSDVILEPKAIENSVKILEEDEKIGAVEPKIYRFELENGNVKKTNTIDTCGFKIFRSRRIINIGHGETDRGQYDNPPDGREIFAVEGAAPFFRKTALEDCRILGEIVDHDMWWYGDDIDLAWRMRLFGWRQIYSPAVVAYHDRKTTHALRKSWSDFIKIRKQIPRLKRRLDYRNSRLMFVKNDYIINFVKDLPFFLKREIPLWGYFLIFEPFMILEIPKIIKMIPKMLKKRKEIMKKAVTSPKEINDWLE